MKVDKYDKYDKYESMWASIGSWKVWETNHEKLLGGNIDRNLKFSLCFKTVQKSR